jgi:alkanesulfonate monooxygenase SsuD/methylene tetrahydromethanopterin reductase-like flavin-dependent oxidoreductase (luciferase family)
MVTTLDVVSEGRAFLGIGASWNEDEFRAYGFGDGLPPIRDRLDRLEEAVEICKAMFTNAIASFDGRHHQIERAINVPVPFHPGGPPILIGGAGERRTLRLVARRADISNILGDITTLRRKLGVLEQHCEELGRDPTQILKTSTCMVIAAPSVAEAERRASVVERTATVDVDTFRGRCIVGDPDAIAEQVAAYLAIGLDGLFFFTDRLWTDDDVAILTEALRML